MKSLVRSLVIAGAVLAVGGARNASAQIDNAVEFTTSFPFTVGNTTVAAGSYTITPDDQDPQILELRGAKTAVIFVTENAQPKELPSKTEIVFARYDNNYVLKNIWVAGSETGYVTESALAEKHLTRSGGSPAEHRIAAHAKAHGKYARNAKTDSSK